MLVTEPGMLTDVRLKHGIQVTFPRGLFPDVSDSPKPKHEGKALEPMLVTELGMLTDPRLVHPLKAPAPMLVWWIQLHLAYTRMCVPVWDQRTRSLALARCARVTYLRDMYRIHQNHS